MSFKITNSVLRPLNVPMPNGEFIHEHFDDGSVAAICRFRDKNFYGPANTTVFLRALITRTFGDRTREYAVLWFISGLQTSIYLNIVDSQIGNDPFQLVFDDNEFADLRAFVAQNKLDRIGVGDEIPYVINEDPLGFHRGK